MSDCHSLIDSKLQFQGKKIDVVTEDYELQGKRHSTDIVRHPGAVVILPITDKEEIVFIQQYRVALSKTICELPAGTLEKGEDPLVCAKREIIEETGFKASDWESLGCLYPAPGFCDELQYCFIARGLSSSYLEADEDEVISRYPLSFKDTKAAIVSGELSDGKSLALLLRASVMGYITPLS